MINQSDIISLRLLEASDAGDFMEWCSDENINKFSQQRTFKSKEDAMIHLAKYIVPRRWFRAICLNGNPIGYISVSPLRDGSDKSKGEIKYVLSSKYWGRGIATKAVKMMVATIFVDSPLMNRLEGKVDIENIGSQRVLEKAVLSYRLPVRVVEAAFVHRATLNGYTRGSSSPEISFVTLRAEDVPYQTRLIDITDDDSFGAFAALCGGPSEEWNEYAYID
ncbi:uncharacterized protein [Solanum lycopersicum]|uniref:uncharacterized protein n=1 Tax=Solanum lycopersicum TaxID=4081 RepID=UPI0037494F1F